MEKQGKERNTMADVSDDRLRQCKEYKEAVMLIEERQWVEKRLDEIGRLLKGPAAALAINDLNRKCLPGQGHSDSGSLGSS
ncbi:MAG: hypothetical protein V7642_5476 [Burkholderiales bacterium]|jgi:hypothetical protein